jgi:dTDP-4-dehydrorhamnose 3,5-epimerase
MEGFSQTSIQGLLIKTVKSFPDFRGEFGKLFLNNHFVEEDFAISYKNVLRGFHYTISGRRLYTTLYGRFYIVALDIREGSETEGLWVPFNINHSNRCSFIIPPGVAFAYLVLSDIGVCHYKWEFKYDQSLERTIRFDDERYNVYWPIHKNNMIISERDFYCDESLIR